MANKRKAVLLPLLPHEGPITAMEIVERPLGTKHMWPVTEEVKAIAGTVESGKAVQLAFRSSEEMKRIQMALRHQVAKMGLKMRYAKGVGARIVAWAERVNESKP